jgi:hypothetical protein
LRHKPPWPRQESDERDPGRADPPQLKERELGANESRSPGGVNRVLRVSVMNVSSAGQLAATRAPWRKGGKRRIGPSRSRSFECWSPSTMLRSTGRRTTEEFRRAVSKDDFLYLVFRAVLSLFADKPAIRRSQCFVKSLCRNDQTSSGVGTHKAARLLWLSEDRWCIGSKVSVFSGKVPVFKRGSGWAAPEMVPKSTRAL